MAMWKHYVVLFGGFFDPGMTTRYLNDLWIFDTQEYNWRLVEFKENELKPSPRSGFSFLSTPEGITLYGGYCKEYIKGKRPIGVMLEDTWLLKMSLQEPDETEAGPGPPSSSAAWAKSKGLKSARSGPGKKDPLSIKWERRKRPSTAYAPALRSGCTMTAWAAKSMGVMFGGVTDEDTNEETLESVFWNDLNGYQWSGKGRWVSLTLKKGKKVKKGPKWDRQKAKAGPGVTTLPSYRRDEELDDMETLDGTETTDGTETVIGSEDIAGDSDDDGNDDEDDLGKERELGKLVSKVRTISLAELQIKAAAASRAGEDIDPDDPILTTPLPRYNAMLAVLRNSLFIYGGIYEKGSREYTLDDFYSIQLDKMDRFVCLKESGIVIPDGDVESSSDEDDDDDDDEEDDDEDDGSTMGDEDEEERVAKKEPISEEDDGDEDTEKEDVENVEVNLRSQAAAFMGVARDAARSPEDVISTPLPGETLAMFYARSREYWTQKAHDTSDNKGKQLKREAFKLAEERYAAYKPILEEVEKILAEAGLDEEEMRRGAAAGPGGATGQSRNRR
ncbi:hypothetical protein D9758_016821 [Tetrapyrgos nigripes]|uniref:DUF4110 domain-containing protein n=1 Tax=Tetrapyrgos nigripes TaxID=182062 RepID=A0A8H5BUU5_9AGAR|nr:hypothetical protein D9758_016821 [Tetrapyrgos nigripes]